MKILALSILFVLMFSRIKNTPISLSKKLWYKKKVKQLERDKVRDDGTPITKVTQGIYILILLLTSMFFIIFYIMLGNKIGTTGFIVMSALQVFGCLWILCRGISDFKIAFSYNSEQLNMMKQIKYIGAKYWVLKIVFRITEKIQMIYTRIIK